MSKPIYSDDDEVWFEKWDGFWSRMRGVSLMLAILVLILFFI
jgi:hypothetical protein